MKQILMTILLCLCFAAILTGCGTTKTRSIELRGMYASESGQLAIGEIEVQAIPEGTDAALIKYEEDNGWLAPSMKLHTIGITLTGTNAVGSAESIVESICKAFVDAAPTLAGVKHEGTTMMDQMGKATEARKAIELGKQAVKTAADTAKKEIELKKLESASSASGGSSTTTSSDCATCTDGTCATCTDCEVK